MKKLLILLCLLVGKTYAHKTPDITPGSSVLLPTLIKNHKGKVVMHWSEKDEKGLISWYFSVSANGGKTFKAKTLIASDAGIGVNRLARPRLLFKPDGTMVAIYSYRAVNPNAPQAAMPKSDSQGASAPMARPKRDSQIRYSSSSNGGKTWSEATSVDTDTSKLTRGFFDAIILPNNEIAVAYLKDVKNSIKHEERDLRLALTKNGIFQEEKLLDAVVCDCCNIGMNLDPKGNLHMYYRDNNNDIRDIAHIVSADNGATFTAPQTLHNDQWEIKGCPHSGASSVTTKSNQYTTWFSGTMAGKAGLRIANNKGQLLEVLDPKAKNATLAANEQKAVWAWEQPNQNNVSVLYTSQIIGNTVAEKSPVQGSEKTQNVSILLAKGKTLVVAETKLEDKKTGLFFTVIN
jgi:hypothetical protein